MSASYPKPDGRKLGRYRPQFDWTNLPAAGRSDPAPKLPAWRSWDRHTRVWWRELWAKPQAVMWPADGSSLVTLACLVDDLVSGRADAAKVSAEIRQHEDRHGLTPKAMLQLRWRIVEPEPVSEVREVRSSSARARMRAVDAS